MKTLLSRLAMLILGLHTLPVLAQREGFDTTVTRKAEITIIEILMPPPADAPSSKNKGGSADSTVRNGVKPDGSPSRVNASTKAVTFENLFFKLDSAELRDRASELQVDDIAAALKSAKLKDGAFLIEGHTCDIGEDEYNMKLSALRAETIRQMLIRRGIAGDRLVVLGFGEKELVEKVKPDDSPAKAETKRMKSRRVVLRRLLPEKAPKK
jgi:outer membrane protein OmpA-like peptidoglycan-associated protein